MGKAIGSEKIGKFYCGKKLSGAENGVELKIHGMTMFTGLESGKC